MVDYTFSDELISDVHKDAYGARPTQGFFQAWKNMSDDEKQKEWDYLLEEIHRGIAEEEAGQKENATRFEQQIAKIQDLMGNSREDAIRVIVQSEDAEENFNFYGYEYIEYTLGLKYGYIQSTL